MGFNYLNGKRWSLVTRDERFFCMRLYELINRETPESFVAYLCDTKGLDVPIEGEWEVGYEVCFYRDLWQHRGRKGKLFSPKRTFDLCLFGEKAIVIIEAKAAVGFSKAQTKSFEKDVDEVKKLTGVENIKLMGLCSSKYNVEREIASIFTGPILHWKELAERYSNDEILLRADCSYKRQQRPFAKYGRHSNLKLSGSILRDIFYGETDWWVGRVGGIRGERFQNDLKTGRWCDQQYEVNTGADRPPSPNYFNLREFVEAVEENATDLDDS